MSLEYKEYEFQFIYEEEEDNKSEPVLTDESFSSASDVWKSRR